MSEADVAERSETGVPREPAPGRRALEEHAALVVTVLAVLAGAALRIREYVFDRSLWLDELSVVDNLLHRSFHGLTEPLGGQQAAPVGWLWAEKAVGDLVGANEYGYRVFPLLGSLVALVLFVLVGRRLVGARAAAVATVLFALSPQLIFYGSEVKQ